MQTQYNPFVAPEESLGFFLFQQVRIRKHANAGGKSADCVIEVELSMECELPTSGESAARAERSVSAAMRATSPRPWIGVP